MHDVEGLPPRTLVGVPVKPMASNFNPETPEERNDRCSPAAVSQFFSRVQCALAEGLTSQKSQEAGSWR